MAELRKSHIIPKFVGKWLKATSATGFLRLATDPVNRAQDLPVLPLLCASCEQLFSKSELYFASQIFFPFHEKGKKDIAYDENLLYFLISLSWRSLKSSYSEQSNYHPWIKPYLNKAEVVWRKFLLVANIYIQANTSFFHGTLPQLFGLSVCIWYELELECKND